MTSRIVTWITVMTVVAALAMPVRLAAQAQDDKPPQQYILKDLGTLGGPKSTLPFFAQVVNNRETVVGGADTAIPNPSDSCFNPFGNGVPDCFVEHAFQWQDDVLTDLGALGTLPDVNFSRAFWINEAGEVVGGSANGLIDPLTDQPAQHAVLWKDGEIVDLGTLGGTQSLALAINTPGQVVGAALNAVPESPDFCLAALLPAFACATQTRAFLWQNGVMQDLGTLGGPDALALLVNDRGQVAGISYTSSTPDPHTGIPPIHPFLWENGSMVDLGTLGGTIGIGNALNNLGQVVGSLDLAGDATFHPFLWDRGVLTDLGTLGGENGEALWLNDAGEIVGRADVPDSQSHHAVLWKDGAMTDLGTVEDDNCSTAWGINARGQIVGTSSISTASGECTAVRAFLWEHGGPMIDLNTRIPADSGLHLVVALSINDRGEIAGIGVPPSVSVDDVQTLGHAFLLIPCDQDHSDSEGCGDTAEGTTAVTHSHPAPITQSPTMVTQGNRAPSGMLAPFRRARMLHD
jgi:probable HAF family extracellular repeat protein